MVLARVSLRQCAAAASKRKVRRRTRERRSANFGRSPYQSSKFGTRARGSSRPRRVFLPVNRSGQFPIRAIQVRPTFGTLPTRQSPEGESEVGRIEGVDKRIDG